MEDKLKGAGEASKIYDKGYSDGFIDAMESKLCKDCNKKKFWEECIGAFPMIKKYLVLNAEDIVVVNSVIDALLCNVSKKEEIEEGD